MCSPGAAARLASNFPSLAALVLPGGFPEQYPDQLSGNEVLHGQIRQLAARGAPVHAECGGLTYLMSDLEGHPMCGVIAGSARFTPRLTLGYRDAVAAADSRLHCAGQRVTGHEFHRTTVDFAVPERDVTARAAGRRPTRLPAGAGGTAPPPAAAAFPQATHRRVSKVRDGGRE